MTEQLLRGGSFAPGTLQSHHVTEVGEPDELLPVEAGGFFPVALAATTTRA